MNSNFVNFFLCWEKHYYYITESEYLINLVIGADEVVEVAMNLQTHTHTFISLRQPVQSTCVGFLWCPYINLAETCNRSSNNISSIRKKSRQHPQNTQMFICVSPKCSLTHPMYSNMPTKIVKEISVKLSWSFYHHFQMFSKCLLPGSYSNDKKLSLISFACTRVLEWG